MSVGLTVNIDGIESALKQLARLDPDLKKDLPRRMKTSPGALALLSDVRGKQPSSPLSGFAGMKIKPWKLATVQKRTTVRAKASDRATSTAQREFLVMRLVSADPAQNLFEMSRGGKTPQGQALARNLNARYGPPSRTMYPALQRHQQQIANDIAGIVDDISDTVGRAI